MKRGERGFASVDAAIALCVISMVLLVGASTLLSIRGRSHDDACLAVRVSALLRSRCEGAGGIVKCEGGYLLANELGRPDYAVLSAFYSAGANASVTAFEGAAPGGACANGLYWRGGGLVRAGACVD